MPYPAPAKHKNSVTMPYRKIKVGKDIGHILQLPGGQRIIAYSWDGSFRVWDLERGRQVGEEWEGRESVSAIASSPGSKTVVTGSFDGAVRLWNINTGKVIKTWTGHTKEVQAVCWSSDGKRVVSGSKDGTCRVWDVESRKPILRVGPTTGSGWAGGFGTLAVCYSPDGKMIATSGGDLKIWDANSGELLKTIECFFTCLAWTSDGKILFAGKCKIDTATWAVLDLHKNTADTISISPNERILASTPYFDETAELWNLETNQPIGTPLHHENDVISATFSADGKFFVTSCHEHLYIWDVSAIIKKAGLPFDIVDATPRPAPKMKGAPQIPPGFFDDALREANLRTRLSQSHGLHNHPTPAPRQRALSPFSSFWRRSKPHRATEPDTQSRSRPLSWTRNLVSGIMRRQDRSDIQLREVEVPCAPGKPRNYHARKKKLVASSSRPPSAHTTQPHSGAAQSTPPSSQQPPPTATISTLSAVADTAGATGTTSRPYITIVSGWRTRVMLWGTPYNKVDHKTAAPAWKENPKASKIEYGRTFEPSHDVT
ncbi:WD40-repeat-containing domain protein [Suillus subluteus]|nr:WD40-repeat-containing domain protein [Suillus subluteus]